MINTSAFSTAVIHDFALRHLRCSSWRKLYAHLDAAEMARANRLEHGSSSSDANNRGYTLMRIYVQRVLSKRTERVPETFRVVVPTVDDEIEIFKNSHEIRTEPRRKKSNAPTQDQNADLISGNTCCAGDQRDVNAEHVCSRACTWKQFGGKFVCENSLDEHECFSLCTHAVSSPVTSFDGRRCGVKGTGGTEQITCALTGSVLKMYNERDIITDSIAVTGNEELANEDAFDFLGFAGRAFAAGYER